MEKVLENTQYLVLIQGIHLMGYTNVRLDMLLYNQSRQQTCPGLLPGGSCEHIHGFTKIYDQLFVTAQQTESILGKLKSIHSRGFILCKHQCMSVSGRIVSLGRRFEKVR